MKLADLKFDDTIWEGSVVITTDDNVLRKENILYQGLIEGIGDTKFSVPEKYWNMKIISIYPDVDNGIAILIVKVK